MVVDDSIGVGNPFDQGIPGVIESFHLIHQLLHGQALPKLKMTSQSPFIVIVQVHHSIRRNGAGINFPSVFVRSGGK